MAFENLSERLQNAIKMFRGSGKITEDDLKAPLREVRMALLEADVNFKVVKDFVANIKERALGETVQQSLTPGQQIIKIVNDELTQLFGRHTKQAHRSGQTAYSHYAGRSAGRW